MRGKGALNFPKVFFTKCYSTTAVSPFSFSHCACEYVYVCVCVDIVAVIIIEIECIL